MNAIKALAQALLLAVALIPLVIKADELADLRAKWKSALIGDAPYPTDSSVYKALVSRNNTAFSYLHGDPSHSPPIPQMEDVVGQASTLTYLWNDLKFAVDGGNSASVTATYDRIEAMVRAYVTDGGVVYSSTAPKSHTNSYYHNPTLKNVITASLQWMLDHQYYRGAPGNALDHNFSASGNLGWIDPTADKNFYDYQIGAPKSLNNIITMLSDPAKTWPQQDQVLQDSLAATKDFNPAIYQNFKGANLMWAAENVALRGVLENDSDEVKGALKGLNGQNLGYDGNDHGVARSLFDYVALGDGFYPDGSFIQHSYMGISQNGFPYTGGYGLALIVDLTSLLDLFNGSTYVVTDLTHRAYVDNWLRSSYEPVIYKGEMMDMERGREISRFDTTSHQAGHAAIAAFIRAASIATNPTDATYYKRAVKSWLTYDTTISVNPYAGFTTSDIIAAEGIMNDPALLPRDELLGHFSFPASARSVHLRPGWGAGLSMHSTRIYSYETNKNLENLAGWNTAGGMLYLYTADQNQYSGNFWPTVDPFRLPGTTVANGFKPAEAQVSQMAFVGGVEDLNGLTGIGVMEMGPAGATHVQASDPVETTNNFHQYGRKAWFFFDDEIVCLGVGLKNGWSTVDDGASFNLETVVENRRLTAPDPLYTSETGDTEATPVNGTDAFVLNPGATGTLPSSPAGMPAPAVTLSGVSWAHLAGGVTAGATAADRGDIGYYFPGSGGVTLKAIRETRSGHWNDINHSAHRLINPLGLAKDFNNYLTLWFDHGIRPGFGSNPAGSYAYAILPNMETADVAAYANAPHFTVLENSVAAQAVRQQRPSSTTIKTGAVFWKMSNGSPGSQISQWSTKTVAYGFRSVTANANAAVLTVDNGTQLDVTASDPSQTNTGSLQISIDRIAPPDQLHLKSADESVEVTSCDPITLAIDLSKGGAGATHGISLHAATQRNWECESLPTSGYLFTPEVLTDANLSGGASIKLPSTSASGAPYIEFTVALPSSGTWKIKAGVRKNNSYGVCSVSLPQANNHILATGIDLYDTAATYGEMELGSYDFNSIGNKTLRFTLTGKNALSSNYYLVFDYLIFTQQP